MTDDISIQEIANTFRAGQKYFKIFEKGGQIADQVMALEQHKRDLEKAVAETSDILAAANTAIDIAKDEAAGIIGSAQGEADRLMHHAKAEIEKAQADAELTLQETLDKSVAAAEILEEREDQIKTLDATLAEKQALITKGNKLLEDIRAKARSI